MEILLPANTRSYDIVIEAIALDRVGDLISARLGARRCVVITDAHVEPLYLERLRDALVGSGHMFSGAIVLEPGEGSKSFASFQSVAERVLAFAVDRKSVIIALGGGVVGDLAGFVAATVMRGVDLVQIPTSLLAQVDSSVGGKNGINSTYGKNTVGTFYQPRLVVCDPLVLKTLAPRELRSGYAEVVKYGFIRDAAFFGWCEKNGAALLAGDQEATVYAIEKSCTHKAAIVAEDERESGSRALLNLGHTFGHALEACMGYDSTKLTHGEGVAIGTVLAFQLSASMGLCSVEDAVRVRRHIELMGLPVASPEKFSDNVLMSYMARDKKVEGGRLTLVLARGIGQAFIAHDVDAEKVRETWREI